jgi:uncharacterized protein YjbI with pentapeptide repeats
VEARKCIYQGEKIKDIEIDWIRDKIKDMEELALRIFMLEGYLKDLGDKANCRFDAIEGNKFCIFHDREYWKTHEEEVREKFLEELNNGESYFVGFHLPSIELPKDIKQPLHMKLAKIHGELTAKGTVFNEEALFHGAWFDGEVRFFETRFNKDAAFIGTHFNEAAWFRKTQFNGKAWFDTAWFNGRAWFDKSQFRSMTGFLNSFFSKDVRFVDTIFLIGSINNSRYTDYISFRRVTFKEPEKVIFDGCNLKRVSFIHTDIRRIKFRNIKWCKDFRIFDEKLFLLKLNKKEFIKEQKKFLKKIINFTKSIKLDDVVEAFEKGIVEISEEMEEIICEPVIYEKLALMKEYKDEKKVKEYNEKKKELEQYYKDYIKKDYINKLKNKLNQIDKDIENEIKNLEDYGLKDLTFKELTLDNVLTVYRNLRENYDYYMKYEESGKFFLNEMKLKRRTLPKLSGEKIVMLLYETLALYGESYIRPLLTLIAIMMTSFFIRLYIHQFDPNVIFDELLKSIDLFGIGSVSGSIDIIERNINVIERLTAIPILGMLIVALRRKLERRVRH